MSIFFALNKFKLGRGLKEQKDFIQFNRTSTIYEVPTTFIEFINFVRILNSFSQTVCSSIPIIENKSLDSFIEDGVLNQDILEFFDQFLGIVPGDKNGDGAYTTEEKKFLFKMSHAFIFNIIKVAKDMEAYQNVIIQFALDDPK